MVNLHQKCCQNSFLPWTLRNALNAGKGADLVLPSKHLFRAISAAGLELFPQTAFGHLPHLSKPDQPNLPMNNASLTPRFFVAFLKEQSFLSTKKKVEKSTKCE